MAFRRRDRPPAALVARLSDCSHDEGSESELLCMTEATSTDVFMPPVCDSLEDGEQIALLRNESDDGSPADPFADSRFWNPALILLFMLTVNAMIYYDRGAISVTVPHIKNDTQIAGGSGQELTGGQAGLLGSAFMGGYMVFSPVFAVLANYIPPSQVLRCGAVPCGAVWCGVVWCGVVWCGVPKALLPKGKRPGCLPTGKGKRAGLCVWRARCV